MSTAIPWYCIFQHDVDACVVPECRFCGSLCMETSDECRAQCGCEACAACVTCGAINDEVINGECARCYDLRGEAACSPNY